MTPSPQMTEHLVGSHTFGCFILELIAWPVLLVPTDLVKPPGFSWKKNSRLQKEIQGVMGRPSYKVR